MKIELLGLLLLAMLNTSAQSTLEISVKNDVGDKIANVSLNIVDNDGKIVFTSKSRSESYFKIDDIYSQEHSIEIMAPGYQINCIAYSTLNKRGVSLVLLDYKIVELQQVDILRDRKQMAVRGDTTFFNVEQKLGVENLGSLLSQLPGIEVRADGKVYFKGRSVSKIYIDGDDLFGANYNLALNRLKARLIAQVQAIENHQEIELYKGISQSNDIVLNLNLSNPDLSDNFQDIGLNLAVAGEIGGAYNRMDLGKMKALTVIGINEYSPSIRPDMFTRDDELPSLEGYFDFKLGSWKEEEKFHLRDRKFQTTHNSLRSFGGNLKLRTSFDLSKITEFDQEAIFREYSSLNSAQFYEQRDMRHSELDSRINLHLFSKNSSEKYVSFTTSAAYTSAKNEIDNISQSAYSRLDMLKKPLEIGLKFEYIKKVEANTILEFKNTYTWKQLFERFSMDDLHFSPYKLRSSMVANSVNYIKKRGSFVNQLGVNQQIITGNISVQDSVSVNRTHMQWILNYAPRFTYRKMEVSTAVSLNGMRIGEYNGQKWNSKRGRVFPSYLFSYKWIPDIRNQFGVSFAENTSLYALEDINSTLIKSDSYIYYRGLDRDGFQSSQSFLASYLHSNLYNQFLAHISLIHLKRINSLGTRYAMEISNILMSKVVSPPLETISLNLGLNKFVGFTNGVIKYNFLNSRNQFVDFMQSESLDKVNVHNLQHTLSYKSTYAGFLNHFSSLELRNSESSTGNSSEFNSKIGLELKLLDRILLGVEYLKASVRARSGKYNNTELRSTLDSKLGKSFNLSIRIMNILNAKEENQYLDNHFERSLKKTLQLPRSMFLQISYTIK